MSPSGASTVAAGGLPWHVRKSSKLSDFPKDPETLIYETRRLLPFQPEVAREHFWKTTEDDLIDVVYGSNLIERAGTSYDITLRLCRETFRGFAASAVVDERSEDYQRAIEELMARGESPSKGAVYRSRAEVIQQAQAFNYFIEVFVLDGEPLTEGLIKHCHAMLHVGHYDGDGNPVGGVCRNHSQCRVVWREGQRQSSVPVRQATSHPYLHGGPREGLPG